MAWTFYDSNGNALQLTGNHAFSSHTGTADSADIASGAIDLAHMSVESVDSDQYVDLSIDTAHLAADAITGAKIADDALDSEHYTNGSIDLAHMSSGTDGNIISYDASGNPVAIATGNTGQVLTSTGAGSPPAFAAAGGGLSNATQYRLTADTARGFLTSNLEVPDTYGYGTLGTAVGESSGVFSFPATGYWLINFTAIGGDAGPLYNYLLASIYTSTDTGSNYYAATMSKMIRSYYYQHGATVTTQFLFDVTNVSTHLVKLYAYVEDTGWAIMGDTGQNETHATFIKLGDT